MLVLDVIMKDNETNNTDPQDNEMDSQVEKDHLEEGEIEEIESGGDGKLPQKPEYQYSKEELLKYSDHPLSRQKPIISDPNVNNQSCWLKSAGWNACKRCDTPTDRGDESHKLIYLPRRINDPRERVRKEQDGIVLSPQRRSFNSGCFVTVAPNTVVRSPAESVKEGPVRRIGSGRIINRDWEFRDKENTDEGYPFRPAGGPSPRERDERFDIRRNYSSISAERELVRDVSRESLSREKDVRADPRVRDRDRLLPRYSIDRRRFEPEEPEWFSGGPTSQHDTIELRGFEDSSEPGSRNSKAKPIAKTSSKPNSRDSKSNVDSRKGSSEEIAVPKGGVGNGGGNGSSSSGGAGGGKKTDKEAVEVELPTATSSPKAEVTEAQKKESNAAALEKTEQTDNPDFLNFEDFLQLDNLPLLTNGGAGEGNQSSSRFSQWFRRDSPSDANDTRRSSIQDELIKNIINDINETSFNIPKAKETDAYFAPISPAGTTSGNSLLEMLQNSHQKIEQHGRAPSIKDLEASGKVTSVEELEARMRQGAAAQNSGNQISQGHTKKTSSSTRKEEELIAFKKLLKQVAEGGVTTANDLINRTSASALLNQMLNKPPEPSDLMGQAHQSSISQQMHVPQDLVYKLLHVQEQQRQVQQQQEFNKLLFSSGRLAPPHVPGTLSPLPPELQMKVATSQPSAELLSRPEAQAILQGLRQGEITLQHLIQQLQNPAMQPRHREVLASILKLHGNTPRPASPLMVPPDPTLIQQLMLQQQLRNQSPLPLLHNAFCQSSMISPNPLGTSPLTLTVQHTGLPHRVPSPRELMLHTQTIMQSALIKKKLEEQRENFRKRQEMQRATSPNLAAIAKSPNPPATSVGTLSSASSSGNILNSSTSLNSINGNSNNSINNNNNNNTNNNNNDNNNKIVGTSGATSLTTTTNYNIAPATSNNGSTTLAATTSTAATKGNNVATTKSPTPLAFTPTSVLRKMTAEQQQLQVKDGDGNKLNKYELFQAKLQRQNEIYKAAQSSRLLNNNQLLGLRSPHQQWPVQKQPLQQPIQQGRAIVKGSSSSSFAAPAPPLGAGLVDLPYGNNGRGVFSQRSKWTIPTTSLVHPNLYNSFPTPANRVLPTRGLAPPMGPLSQPKVNVNPALQHLLMSQNATSAQHRTAASSLKPGIRNSFSQFLPPNGGDGDLSSSPNTSNQLAHWFTPELLAQAQVQTRTGKSDSTLNMVSVEELERLQQNSAPVIN